MRAVTFAAAACGAAAIRDLPSRHKLNARHPRTGPVVPPSPAPTGYATPGTANCTLNWFEQTIDHFGWAAPPTGEYTYLQRWYSYDKWWNKETGAIWFYNGNEADVTLYVDHSGLMWENAQAAGALLVFAEHRFYGSSLPCGAAWQQCVRYLTHEQAQADFAALAFALQASLNVTQPVILFGGSYGGKLAAWTRIKYPGVFAGAVAASAPVLAFQGQTPPYDPTTYWAVVTRDATPAAGAAEACAANVRAAWGPFFDAASTPSDLAALGAAFSLCTPPGGEADVFALGVFLLNALDTLAMGNYGYPSNYLTGGGNAPLLPAWPVQAACNFLADPALSAPGNEWKLLAALGRAAGVFNNATANVACYSLPDDIWEDGIWDAQWCTELLPEETYFARNGVTDMFWPWAINNSGITAHCQGAWGVTPRFNWIAQAYGVGGLHGADLGGSNIVFSNGGYDPWSSGGVGNISSEETSRNVHQSGATSPAVRATIDAAAGAGVTVRSTPSGMTSVWIPDGAHHVDLFFTNPADTPSTTAARKVELALIAQWTADWYAARAPVARGARGEL